MSKGIWEWEEWEGWELMADDGEGDFDDGFDAGLALEGELAAEEFGEALGDDEAEAGALLFESLPVELDMRADARHLLGGHAAAVIGDGDVVGGLGNLGNDVNRLAAFGKLEGVLDQFLDDFAKIIRRNEQAGRLQVDVQIRFALVAFSDGPREFGNDLVRRDRVNRAGGIDLLRLGGHQLNL